MNRQLEQYREQRRKIFEQARQTRAKMENPDHKEREGSSSSINDSQINEDPNQDPEEDVFDYEPSKGTEHSKQPVVSRLPVKIFYDFTKGSNNYKVL
jgi:hypothetical protein